MFAAESSTLLLETLPTSGLADPLRFPLRGLKPHVRFSDSSDSSVGRGICSVPVVPRAAYPWSHPVLEHMAAVSLVQECTAPVTLLA